MKILMLAPEPYFQPRGTPISVFFRLKTLSEIGHSVDLITYHLGEDKTFPGVRIMRIPNFFFIKKIKIGPSYAKPPLDFLLFWKAFWRLLRTRYDVVFTHEEAGFFGGIFSKIFRVAHIYDMHSSLPQQLENFAFSRSRILKRIFMAMERFILKNSQAVIVICPDLVKRVEEEGFGSKSVLIENVLDFEYPEFSEEEVSRTRKLFASSQEKIVLYAGNFQPYQGIPLLLEAASKLKHDRIKLLIVGESKAAVDRMQKKAHELNISKKVTFTGQVPPSQVPLYIRVADALVSPRLSGTNTPLKIYSFLKSGKPVVATNLWTHTQVLNEKISILVDPDAQSLAEGLRFALFDQKAQERASEAKSLAEREYTFSRYTEKIKQVLAKAAYKENQS